MADRPLLGMWVTRVRPSRANGPCLLYSGQADCIDRLQSEFDFLAEGCQHDEPHLWSGMYQELKRGPFKDQNKK